MPSGEGMHYEYYSINCHYTNYSFDIYISNAEKHNTISDSQKERLSETIKDMIIQHEQTGFCNLSTTDTPLCGVIKIVDLAEILSRKKIHSVERIHSVENFTYREIL